MHIPKNALFFVKNLPTTADLLIIDDRKFSSRPPAIRYSHSKVEAIPLSALPKDTTSELAGLSPH